MELQFSIIIPVYNRPQEIDELLKSLTKQSYSKSFEVVIVEDGSENISKEIVQNYSKELSVKYFLKNKFAVNFPNENVWKISDYLSQNKSDHEAKFTKYLTSSNNNPQHSSYKNKSKSMELYTMIYN